MVELLHRSADTGPDTTTGPCTYLMKHQAPDTQLQDDGLIIHYVLATTQYSGVPNVGRPAKLLSRLRLDFESSDSCRSP